MTERLEAKGIKLNEYMWDDKSDHDAVTKIYIRSGLQGLLNIYADYVKSGQLKEGPTNGRLGNGYSTMFGINHLENEHLQSVDVYYNEPNGIQALQFKTNFKTSELMGDNENCTKFTLAVQGKKIIGFHGSAANGSMNSLGAYFTWITPTRLEVKGGKGGNKWDDGYDHDNVSKIHLRGGSDGIQFIKFDYVKNGQFKNGSLHGVSRRGGFIQTFVIDHLNKEYLISVEGYYDDASGVIQGLEFQTNIKKSELMGYDKGSKFSLGSNGNKITGFHGYAEKSLNSIGAYITTTTPNKLECQGFQDGFFWDDGSNHDGIRAVYIDALGSVDGIGFVYDHKGKAERTHRMARRPTDKEFVLDYPNEFLTTVEGTMFVGNPNITFKLIMSLTLKTSKGRTSPTYGVVNKEYHKFLLEKKGNALVGFYGWSGNADLRALGAYYRPMPPPPDAEKLVAQGGDGGASWDDGGTFYGIRKIYIGVSGNAIGFIKFMYFKSTRMVFGDDHGNKTQLFDVHEFQLNYPLETITSVEGSYDDKSGVITMLRFKTDRQTSPDFGVGTTSTFVLEKTDHQIVGFHGKSSNMLHKIGVHVLPNNFQFQP